MKQIFTPRSSNLTDFTVTFCIADTVSATSFFTRSGALSRRIRLPFCSYTSNIEKQCLEVIAKRFVMPDYFYRASMISGSYKLDSRSEALRE